LSATLLGIFIIPVTFYVVEKLTLRITGHKPNPETPAAAAPPASDPPAGHGPEHP
jgi:hypothetical protein